MHRRILMILYYYPPIGGIGMLRTLRVAKYLPDLGWEPLVLTVGENTLRAIACDGSEGELDGVRVFRSRNPDLAFRLKRRVGLDISQNVASLQQQECAGAGRLKAKAAGLASDWMGIPDRMIDWYPFARRRAIDICKACDPSVIFSSSPPETSHLVASAVRSATGLPWLADMRDPWTDKFDQSRAGLPGRVNALLETRFLPGADCVTAISGPVAADLRERLNIGRVVEMPNSYDEDDFTGVPAAPGRGFNIFYAGTLAYPGRDPRPLFRAIRKLGDEGGDLSRVTVEFAGKDSSVAERIAREEGVGERVSALGLLPYGEVLSREKGAAALLYLQWEPRGDRVPSAKLYEYLGAARPILAITPTPGAVDDVIRVTRAGEVAHDQAEVEGALSRWIEEYERTGSAPYEPSSEIHRYTSRSMVEKFAGLLEELAGPGR